MTANDQGLVDSHCHIHDSQYDFDLAAVWDGVKRANLCRLICVGTSLETSRMAVDFSVRHSLCYPSVGLHPHLAAELSVHQLQDQFRQLKALALKERRRLVAIGECGLDYHYHQDLAVRQLQQVLLNWQLELAADLKLPLIFHIRSAFADFWPIYQLANQPAGVVHSFSDSLAVAQVINTNYRQLYFGLNGIMTFSKNPDQLAAAKAIADDRLILETDSPYLTPVPFRGKINTPENLRIILDFIANLRGQSSGHLARLTTRNANNLFDLGL